MPPPEEEEEEEEELELDEPPLELEEPPDTPLEEEDELELDELELDELPLELEEPPDTPLEEEDELELDELPPDDEVEPLALDEVLAAGSLEEFPPHAPRPSESPIVTASRSKVALGILGRLSIMSLLITNASESNKDQYRVI